MVFRTHHTRLSGLSQQAHHQDCYVLWSQHRTAHILHSYTDLLRGTIQFLCLFFSAARLPCAIHSIYILRYRGSFFAFPRMQWREASTHMSCVRKALDSVAKRPGRKAWSTQTGQTSDTSLPLHGHILKQATFQGLRYWLTGQNGWRSGRPDSQRSPPRPGQPRPSHCFFFFLVVSFVASQ